MTWNQINVNVQDVCIVPSLVWVLCKSDNFKIVTLFLSARSACEPQAMCIVSGNCSQDKNIKLKPNDFKIEESIVVFHTSKIIPNNMQSSRTRNLLSPRSSFKISNDKQGHSVLKQ